MFTNFSKLLSFRVQLFDRMNIIFLFHPARILVSEVVNLKALITIVQIHLWFRGRPLGRKEEVFKYFRENTSGCSRGLNTLSEYYALT